MMMMIMMMMMMMMIMVMIDDYDDDDGDDYHPKNDGTLSHTHSKPPTRSSDGDPTCHSD